ncbi:hydrogenase 3 maturation endopeptidase HyCI [bacterium]|nr:hydrogenase 3 maturation endopeptidase HyCI [bacterium]
MNNVDEIKKILIDKSSDLLIITVGNTFRSDDGVGPYIYSKLKSSKKIKILNADENPENIVDDAIAFNPDKIIFIDAGDWGGVPGEIKIISEDQISKVTFSTHMIPLNVVSALIRQDIDAEIVFLGIQILSMEFKEGICEAVKSAADELVGIIKN